MLLGTCVRDLSGSLDPPGVVLSVSLALDGVQDKDREPCMDSQSRALESHPPSMDGAEGFRGS